MRSEHPPSLDPKPNSSHRICTNDFFCALRKQTEEKKYWISRVCNFSNSKWQPESRKEKNWIESGKCFRNFFFQGGLRYSQSMEGRFDCILIQTKSRKFDLCKSAWHVSTCCVNFCWFQNHREHLTSLIDSAFSQKPKNWCELLFVAALLLGCRERKIVSESLFLLWKQLFSRIA